MTSILKPEKALVSAAGTLRMLRDVDNILRDKPFIPVHMVPVMPDTALQLTAGQAALAQAVVVVHREVQSFLDEWAADLDLKNGSTFGATFTPSGGEASDALRIEGCVHHCEVSPRLVDSTRMVYVFLTYPSFKLKSGQSAATVRGLTKAFRKRVASGYLQSQIGRAPCRERV